MIDNDQEESVETTFVDEINLLLSIKDAKISDLKRSTAMPETVSRDSSHFDAVKLLCDSKSSLFHRLKDQTASKVDHQVLLSQEEEIAWHKKQLEEKKSEAESLVGEHQRELEKRDSEIEELKSELESTLSKRKSIELQKRHRRQLNAKIAKIKQLEGVVTALENQLKDSSSKHGTALASYDALQAA